MTWAAVKSVAVNVTVKNDGTALNIGSSYAYCNTTITVNQVPLPPTLSNTVFFVPELSPVGTWVGNVGAVDPANFTVSGYVWAAVDSVRRRQRIALCWVSQPMLLCPVPAAAAAQCVRD